MTKATFTTKNITAEGSLWSSALRFKQSAGLIVSLECLCEEATGLR